MHRSTKPFIALAALSLTLALSACGTGGTVAASTANGATRSTASSESATSQATAESNKHVMERFTQEFLPTGDATLAKGLISPDIVMHFAGQQQTGRDTYLNIVAANS